MPLLSLRRFWRSSLCRRGLLPIFIGLISAALVIATAGWSFGDDDYTDNPTGIQSGGTNAMYFGNLSSGSGTCFNSSNGFIVADANQAGHDSTFGNAWLYGPGTSYNNNLSGAYAYGEAEGQEAAACWSSSSDSSYIYGLTVWGDVEDSSWGYTNSHSSQWQANANVISGYIAGLQAAGLSPGIYVGWAEASGVLDGWGWNPGFFPVWSTGSCGPAVTQYASNPEPYAAGTPIEADFNAVHADNQSGSCRAFGQYSLMWQYIISHGTGYDQAVDYDLTPYQDNGAQGVFPATY